MKRLAFIASTVVFSVATWIVYPGYSPNDMEKMSSIQDDTSEKLSLECLAFVGQRDIVSFVTETGTAGYRTVFNVNAQTGGKLKSCSIKAGDRVQKGDVIAELENEELFRQKETAQRNFEQAEQALSHYHTYNKVEREKTLQLQYESVKEQYDLAVEALENSDECFKRGMISKKECEKIARQHKNAKTLLELEKLKLEKQAKLNEEEEKKLSHLVEESRAQLQKIEEAIGYLKITSPLTGKILEMSRAFPSDTVKSNIVHISKGEMIASIAEEMGRYVEVKLFGQDVAGIKMDDAVDVLFEQEQKVLKGRVKDISPVGVSYGQYYRYPVLVEVVENADSLRAGQLVRCRFLISERKSISSIPIAFLFYKEGKKYCKVKIDDGIIESPVVTGIDDGEFIEIVSGLELGQEICM